jgi:hypothetical protein
MVAAYIALATAAIGGMIGTSPTPRGLGQGLLSARRRAPVAAEGFGRGRIPQAPVQEFVGGRRVRVAT